MSDPNGLNAREVLGALGLAALLMALLVAIGLACKFWADVYSHEARIRALESRHEAPK